jgi:glyoxylase-like metal-dependent hydrolase (beta-lactamase superfamily II)
VEQNHEVESDHFDFIELEDGVYSCIHKFGGKATCNVGVVDNGKETIIFDSFLSPTVMKELLDHLNKLDLSPIKYVVNSHYHNDHVRGNQVFSNDVRIISTTKTKELIEEEEPLNIEFEKENAPARFAYYDSLFNAFDGDKQSREYKQILMWRPYYETLSNSHAEVQTRLPDLPVDSFQNFDGPERGIQLISKGPGHTESDLVMYLPYDQIVFTGDLIFNKCHPYVPHGDILKWKEWLDFLNSLNVKTVIPGHGQPGTNALIGQMKHYLLDLEISASNLSKNDQSIDSVDVSFIPDQYKDWWFDRFYVWNLQFAYASIQKTDLE